MATHELNCPQCSQVDKVQKVSALYTSGVSAVEYETWRPPPPKSDLPPLLETRKGVSQTGLSARLAPPEKPGPKGISCFIWGIAVVLIFWCGGLTLSGLSEYFPGRLESGIVGTLLGIGILVWAITERSKRQEEAAGRIPQWKEAMRRWEQLYYCARCDGVFIPDETPLIPTGGMSEFLFAAPTKPPKFFEEVKEEVEEPEYKECPRCAEMIRVRAKACRFCGYEFSPEELAEEEQKRAEREVQRAERERVEREKAEKELEAEYRVWHPPERIRQWGQTVVECPHCSTLNTTNVSSCRRCSADLSSAPTVRNPYLFAEPTELSKLGEVEEVEEPEHKECPHCAEMIRVRAKACRFCGYEFSPEELAEEERKRAEREARRAERERVEREKAEKERLDAEYRMWHPPERIRQWGQTVVKCPQCSTINTTNMSSCRRCSADLSSAPTVRNPYL